jgi:hypothetical protein
MKVNWRFSYIFMLAVPIILGTGVSTAQNGDICSMQTSSGHQIPLDKLCGKSGEKPVSGLMWDENNYDPKFVTHEKGGSWSVLMGAPHPFKYPDGSILWPDGRITEPEGYTSKLVIRDDKVTGVQYYKPDGVTPLRPGETMTFPTGHKVIQQDVQ